MNALDIQPDMIDEDLLPQGLQELCEVIGLEAALKLAATYPGVPLYIPNKADPAHSIALVIGPTAFEALVESYQGETLRLNKVDAALRQIKHQMAGRLISSGNSNRQIALALNYTQRHVERLRAQIRNEQQRDLFED